MTDRLSPQAQKLVDLSVGTDEPTPSDRVRVRRGLALALSTGAASAASTLASATKASVLGASVFGSKWIVLGALCAAVPATVLVRGWVRDRRRINVSSVGTSEQSHSSAVLPPRRLGDIPAAEPSFEPKPALLSAPSAAVAPPAAVTWPGATAPPTGATPPVAAPTSAGPAFGAGRPSDRDSTLSAQMRMLEAAQGELRSRRPEKALGLLREQAQRFPGGALEQERMAAEVLALCSLGRVDEARGTAERFARVFPRSPLLSRVQSSCVRPR
jgi:hypothetical protein